MLTIRRILIPIVLLELSIPGQAILFGGGSCCCSCGIPMPAICGCPRLQLPVCPPPLPCPAAPCPVCQVCPPPQPCPPPPVAVCPAPQPVYVQPSCGCGGGVGGGAIGGGVGTIGGGVGAFGGGGSYQGGAPLPTVPVQGATYLGGPQGAPEGGAPYAQPFPQPGALSQGFPEGSQQGQPIPQGSYSEGHQQQVAQAQTQAAQADAAPVPDSDAAQQSSPSTTPSTQTARRARGAVTISENKCNSVILEELLTKNIDETDPVASKRAIHKAAQENVKDAVIDIICSDAGFTYIVSTSEYCEAQKEKVICFVYKKP